MSDSTHAELNPPTPDRPASDPGSGSSAATAQSARRSRHRRRRRSRRLARLRSGLWPVALALLLIVIIAGVWGGTRAYAGWRAYQSTRADVDRLQAQASIDPGKVSTADLAAMHVNFQDLSFDLNRLDRVLTTTGAAPILGHLPWAGPRYHAAQQLLTIGQLLASAGDSGSAIAQQTLTAFEGTGAMATGTAPASPTWLDVVSQHDADLRQIAQQVQQAQTLRASLNTSLLPGRVRAKLPLLDKWLNKYDVQQFANADLPAIQTALGATADKRYMVIFQDNQNLRPAGGFAGTLALVTVSHGRITSYSFSTSTPLSNAYNGNRSEVIPQPWPLQQYLAQDGFQIQDALWWGDFPRSAQMYMQMYAETGWPPIDGIVAVQPAAVSDILRVTGPITVDVDGQQRTVTADNLLQEIDRQEILRRQGVKVDATHKEVLEEVGAKLIAQIAASKRGELAQIARKLAAAANRRDIQTYASDQSVQAALDARGWTGKLVPDPTIPTLAVTMGNVAENKSALTMQPSMDLTFGALQNGKQQVTLKIDLANNGKQGGDPLYDGFQRWYIEVQLPKGSTLDGSQPDALPNPEAPDGGSYLIEIFPQQVGHLTVSFTMPQTDQLVFRRQPGLNDVALKVSSGTCAKPSAVTVRQDLVMSPTSGCN